MIFVDTSFWAALRNRRDAHHDEAVEQSPRVQLIVVSEALEDEALRWLRRHDEREYSFVDATSFAVMRSVRLHEALAFGVRWKCVPV